MNGLNFSSPLIFIVLLTLFSGTLLLSACGKSETDLCIDKQSHLWNTKANSREENKIYWDAVTKCKEKFKK
ncbi:MAG: hypothetical protein L3J38_06170 [Thiomicrorhabdus sp.]|nr:hypothetical protein [Thiomicrorhabdus sp.]